MFIDLTILANSVLRKNFPEMNNKSTDMKVYNESKQRSRNLLVYHSKATVVFFIYFFDLLE